MRKTSKKIKSKYRSQASIFSSITTKTIGKAYTKFKKNQEQKKIQGIQLFEQIHDY